MPIEPTDLNGAVGTVKDAVVAAKGGRWWYFSALVLVVLMFALKQFGLLAKMGRAKYIVPPILSLAAALGAAFQGGVSVDAAVGVFTSSWATASLEELWNHGILGKSRGT